MVSVKELKSKEQTGKEMYHLADKYANDISLFQHRGTNLDKLPIRDYFNLISTIPFKKDITGVEVVTRPLHIFRAPWVGWDCKKKSIAMAAYLKNNNIPYRFTAVSMRPDGKIHHVMPQAHIDSNWHDLDATYSHNRPFRRNPRITNMEVLPMSGSGGNLTLSPKLISMYGYDDPETMLAADYWLNRTDLERIEYMGQGWEIVAGAIAAIGAIWGSAISSDATVKAAQISAKAKADELNKLLEFQREQVAAAQKAKEQATQLMKKWLIPAGIAGSLILLPALLK